jgi:hypothetical protein
MARFVRSRASAYEEAGLSDADLVAIEEAASAHVAEEVAAR